jgi:hypothetical protein
MLHQVGEMNFSPKLLIYYEILAMKFTTLEIDLKVLDRIYDRQAFEIKPILRQLSDMTDTEHNELMRICFEDKFKTFALAPVGCSCPLGFAYLLSKQFDLFGLIESGLAIDATTKEFEEIMDMSKIRGCLSTTNICNWPVCDCFSEPNKS